MIQMNNVQEDFLPVHDRFLLLVMLLNYVSGPYPIAHRFFLKWKTFRDTNTQAGLHVHILYSRVLLDVKKFHSASEAAVVISNGPWVQADS